MIIKFCLEPENWVAFERYHEDGCEDCNIKIVIKQEENSKG